MKTRPILFSAPMVRALLDGTKTQTRRIVKPQRHPFGHVLTSGEVAAEFIGETCAIRCPYGQPGGRLWVRETHWVERAGNIDGSGRLVFYKATDPDFPYGWKPSIHMPRWASRLTLEIVSVRVERLQDISEKDVFAEGIQRLENHSWDAGGAKPLGTYQGLDEWSEEGGFWTDAVSAYAALWESINGPGSWAANPFVWVVELKRVTEGATP